MGRKHIITSFILSIAIILGISESSVAAIQPTGTTEKPASIIRTKNPKKIVREAKKRGLTVSSVNALPSHVSLVTIEGSPLNASIQELSQDTKTSVSQSHVYKATDTTPNDTNYGSQWNLLKIAAPAAWDISTGSSTTTIAVIDTGVLSSQSWGSSGPFTQPDFPSSKIWNNSGEVGTTQSDDTCWTGTPEDKSANECDDDSNGYIDDWRGWDFMGGFRGPTTGCPNFSDPTTYQNTFDSNYVDQDNDPQPYSCDSPSDPTALNKTDYDGTCIAFTSACYVGHGTMASSAAAAASNNGALIAGVNWNAKIMPIRALDGYGSGTSAQIAAGIEYAVANGADVINMSLAVFDGNGSCTISDSTVNAALSDASDAGVVVVAAAGNTGTAGVCYPARAATVIAAGASTTNDTKASFSSYGPEIDLVAPGQSVPLANAPSNASNSTLVSGSGTSFSSPHVAGAAALMRDIFPSLSPNGIANLLRQNADEVSGMNGTARTDNYGYGRLNLYEAANAGSTGAYGGIRLITCSGSNYLVERGTARKRPISDVAMTEWSFDDAIFHDSDSGCSYPTYDTPLDRVVRSRSSNKLYFIANGKAQQISSSAAKTWGIETGSSVVYPKFDDNNIYFLPVTTSMETYSPSIGASTIRLFSCDGQNYMVERGIRKKRSISATGLEAWKLSDAYFAPDVSRCDYPSYSTSLDRLIRSRDTGKSYLTDRQIARHVKTGAVTSAWGLGDVNNATLPQFYGDSIHFLSVAGDLPRLGKSESTNKVYLADAGNRYYIKESEVANSTPLQLVRGYDEVPQATVSVALLQTLTSGADLNYSFKVGSDWYLLNHNNLRRINSAYTARWETFISSPTLSSDVLSLFSSQETIDFGWRRDSYYYRVTTEGDLERTTNASTAASWGVENAAVLTRLLTNRLISEQGVSDL